MVREIEKESEEEQTDEGKKEAQSPRGPACWALLSCLCMPQLADIILAALPGGVSIEVSTVTSQGSLSLSVSVCVSPPSLTSSYFDSQPPPFQKKRASLKSPLHHVSQHSEAPGVPLRSFPWSLGSSLCHVAQSEPSLGQITQLSMEGQMTIIRLHSLGPYLKREERSPGDLR